MVHRAGMQLACSPVISLLTVSLVLGILCSIVWQLLLHQTPLKNPPGIQYVQWVNNESNPHYMTEWLAQQNVPLVLTDTPFNKWHSINWTLTSLAQNSHIERVLSKKGTNNVFKYFAVDQPLSNIDFMTTEKDFIEVIYPRKKFFELLQQPFDGHYYYSSGGVELLNLDGEIFSDKSLGSLTFPSHQEGLGQVNYWFGSENVTAYTHYDTSYNLHMIVRGRKKFILFPPENYRTLELYPCLHQFYRQTFTDIFRDDDTVQHLGGIEVVLNPGEVMYLPPYWFHSVVTMETTISLNVWSHSDVFLIMEEVYSEGIPFEEHWGRVKLMKALNYFIKRLTQIIFKRKDQSSAHRNFVREGVYSRYEPLIEQAQVIGHVDVHQVRSKVSGYCLDIPVEKLVNSAELEHINFGINKLVDHFARISLQPVMELNLGNYIEHLVFRILGPAADDLIMLPFYLQTCF